ncbi:hypothetical protein TPHA_0N01270 [Tetrapisispora phaffii CBS 4417]|uniref:Uncharacterized protein n=1 Tax=Tetrapisispora phaffii (strain ATCC 24235 / CBS 4417 / NBRC 1672 / NRRL Y-8282 / UCD 70-5) TaxID=1071381 RepID=G8C180_TETPH|nr:hypothetical protein TPHA_0N01270 [Tetrapisispora phaffii CBS 4417]CCE65908.1 hypothetical protein TPHA_0N01270 [Tetrapisispora phaffii CBS 4417]
MDGQESGYIDIEELRRQLRLRSQQQIYSNMGRATELSQDPTDVKSYLNDLSVALASQREATNRSTSLEDLKSTSMSVETTEAHSISDDRSISAKAERGSEIAEIDGRLNSLGTAEGNSVIDTVFAGLSSMRSKTKRRKISSFIITDNQTATEATPDTNAALEPIEEPMYFSDQNEHTEPVQEAMPEATTYNEENTLLEDADEPEPYETQRLKPAQLKNMFGPYLNHKQISLPPASWQALSTITGDLTSKITTTLQAEQYHGSQQLSIERSSLVALLVKYKLLPRQQNLSDRHITTEELFSMCKQYLTSEDLNDLEISLFS